MREAPDNVGDAVDRADRRAGDEHRHHDERSRIDRPENQPADDGRERQVGPDREVDAPGEDGQLLTHRDDGDDRGLGENVADIAGRRKTRRHEADHRCHEDEDEHRT